MQFVWHVDAAGKQVALRDVSHDGARGYADGALAIGLWASGGRLLVEHHDTTTTRTVATVAVPASAKPLAFARGTDGRVAVAIKIGKLVERKLGGRRIQVSQREMDSLLATAPAIDQLSFAPAK